MRIRAALLVASLVGVFLLTAAGAAGGAGQLTVSNRAPAPGSAITVTSTGWASGNAVTVALDAEVVLARVDADATGSVRARISIPADVMVDLTALSVTGISASGVPQQIVTSLTVNPVRSGPAPARPWVAILLLIAIAAALLLASITTPKPVARLAS